MQKLPKISIITPSYNQSQFLEKTILSVLSQNYPDIEYIVMDGGSTDGSTEIIKRYADRIAHWCSEPDNGQSDALNKGFGMASGDIIAWINSDDVYEKGAFEKVARYLGDHPRVGMVYGDCSIINEDGEVYGNEQPGPFAIDRYLGCNLIPQPTAFIRRSVIEGDRLVDESLHYAMDYDLWLRISRKHEIGYLPSTLAMFRYHSASKTISRNDKFAFELCLILHDYIKVCGEELAHVVMKNLAREMTRLNGKEILSVLELMEADLGPGLLTTDDRYLLKGVIDSDGPSRETVLMANALACEIYLGYFGKYMALSSEEEKVAGSIFYRQLESVATAAYRDSPARSRRLFRSLVSAFPGMLREGHSIKLLARVLITPAGDRLLADLKHIGIRLYVKCRIIKLRLVP